MSLSYREALSSPGEYRKYNVTFFTRANPPEPLSTPPATTPRHWEPPPSRARAPAGRRMTVAVRDWFKRIELFQSYGVRVCAAEPYRARKRGFFYTCAGYRSQGAVTSIDSARVR